MIGNGEIEIRLADSSEKKQLIELYNRNLHPIRSDLSWDWEFFDTPHGEPIHSTIWLGSELIGQNIIIPILMQFKGCQLITGRAQALLIEKKYQFFAAKKRIVEKLFDFVFSECLKRDITLVWGMPNAKAARSFEQLGFVVNEIHSLRSDITFNQMLLPLSTRLAEFNNRPCDSIVRILSKVQKPQFNNSSGVNEVKIINEKDNYKKYAEVIRRKSSNSSLAICRDEAFINWRFVNNPFHANLPILFEYKGEIVAGVILSFHKQSAINKCYIVDMVMDDRVSEKVAAMVIKKLHRFCRSKGVDQLVLWETYRNLFSGNNVVEIGGFCNPKKAGYFAHKVLSKKGLKASQFSDSKEWSITMAFMEGTSF